MVCSLRFVDGTAAALFCVPFHCLTLPSAVFHGRMPSLPTGWLRRRRHAPSVRSPQEQERCSDQRFSCSQAPRAVRLHPTHPDPQPERPAHVSRRHHGAPGRNRTTKGPGADKETRHGLSGATCTPQDEDHQLCTVSAQEQAGQQAPG